MFAYIYIGRHFLHYFLHYLMIIINIGNSPVKMMHWP